MTEWQISGFGGFEWAEQDSGISREDWVAADGGFWVYPPAGNNPEPVWFSDQQVDEGLKGYILKTVSAIIGAVPGIGNIKDVIQAIAGRDIITGEKLSWFERAINLSGLFADALRPVSEAGRLEATQAVLSGADALLDCQQLFESQAGSLEDTESVREMSERMRAGAEQLRQGADLNSLDWTPQTTAILNAGMLEARRLTEKLAEQHPLSPEQAEQVREVLLKAFVRQAQADGALPMRLEVVPSLAEGGDPSQTIDVRDPMTGTTWDVSDNGGGSSGQVVTHPGS